MRKKFPITEFESDCFLHSRVKAVRINLNTKSFEIDIHAADLKNGYYITTCTITITDWWSLEVYEYNKFETVRIFSLKNIPELNQILDFSFSTEELIFTGIGLHNNTAIDYKFTKPKIDITGEYDPD